MSEFGPDILEFIPANSLGSDREYFEPMKLLVVPVNPDHTSGVIVFIFQ
jgi:hypothetical protein